MKKILGILIFLTLAITCILGITAAAYAETADNDTAHLINPTAMTVVGDYLYVADNVEENKSAILIFNIQDNLPKQAGTYEISEAVTNLSNDGENALYATCGNKVIELSITSGASLTVSKTYENFEEPVLDFAKGIFVNSDTQYALTSNKLLKNNGNAFGAVNQTANEQNSFCLSFNNCIFYITRIGDSTQIKCYDGSDGTFREVVFATTGFVPVGLLTWDGKIAMYSADSICYFTETSKDNYAPAELIKGIRTDDDKPCNIVDVQAKDGKLLVLNDNKKIDIYQKNTESEDFYLSATIGSDIVEKTVPTVFTNFTLVKSNGYPTNIIYKTNEKTSITDLIDNASEYLVLGYEGEENSSYYYVMVNNRYGWVKKSDKTATVETDGKLEVTDLKLDNGQVGYVTKFNSLNAITIYQLPHHDSDSTTITQTASTMKEVTLLKKFTETTTDKTYEWYWVEYEDGQRGFAEREKLGNFRAKQKTDGIDILYDRKINSTLFVAVTLYSDKDLTESGAVYDEQDNLIKLYSGDRVTVIEESGSASFIMRQRNDGTQDFGWVETSRLIDVHAITANAVVGLSLTGAAIIIAVVLTVVLLKRRKRIKANKD